MIFVPAYSVTIYVLSPCVDPVIKYRFISILYLYTIYTSMGDYSRIRSVYTHRNKMCGPIGI